MQDAWNSWLNFKPVNETDVQIRTDFLTSAAPNRCKPLSFWN